MVARGVRHPDLPEDPEQLKSLLEQAYGQLSFYARDLQRLMETERAGARQIAELKKAVGSRAAEPRPASPHTEGGSQSELCGTSAAMQRVMRLCVEVAHTDASVILTGETGVGKEVAARTIHRLSHRRDRPFVAVNCAALPETLLESGLVGEERGASAGATQPRPGHFEMPEGGTRLLDERGGSPLPMQAKLLRRPRE